MTRNGRYFGILADSLLFVVAVAMFSSAAADPSITGVDGEFAQDSRLVITGTAFTDKAEAKPLFWWMADGGDDPSPLGRKSAWDGGFDGDDERQQVVVAPGSRYSYRFDHGASTGAALGYVRWTYGTPKIYLWRKKYDDFDVREDGAIRTRFINRNGEFQVGQTVIGQTSGATGIIQSVFNNTDGQSGHIRYESGQGTAGTKEIPFVKGEVMTTSTATAINDEGQGTYYGFNNKVMRIWPEDPSTGDTSKGSAVWHAHSWDKGKYGHFIEHIGPTYWGSERIQQVPNQWNIEEMLFEESSAQKVADGTFAFGMNGLWTPTFGNVTTLDDDAPYYHSRIYQSQVSNGAQPNSWAYYDALYIDDSWHRVLASNDPAWTNARDLEVQIPVVWTDDRIEIVARLGSLDPAKPVYLYVIDSENRVNQEGFAVLCDKCPVPPARVTVD